MSIPQLPNPKMQFGVKKPCMTKLPLTLLIPLAEAAKVLDRLHTLPITQRINNIMFLLIAYCDGSVNTINNSSHPILVAIVHSLDLAHDVLNGTAVDDRPIPSKMKFDEACARQMALMEKYKDRVPAAPFLANLQDEHVFPRLSETAPFNELPFDMLTLVSVAMYEGAIKYGDHNYRSMDYKILVSTYIDAAFRHILQFCFFGEDIDVESDSHHLIKLIASLMVLGDSIFNNQNVIDDRPIPSAAICWEKNKKNA